MLSLAILLWRDSMMIHDKRNPLAIPFYYWGCCFSPFYIGFLVKLRFLSSPLDTPSPCNTVSVGSAQFNKSCLQSIPTEELVVPVVYSVHNTEQDLIHGLGDTPYLPHPSPPTVTL